MKAVGVTDSILEFIKAREYPSPARKQGRILFTLCRKNWRELKSRDECYICSYGGHVHSDFYYRYFIGRGKRNGNV